MEAQSDMKDVFVDHLSFALGDQVCSVEESAARGRLYSSASSLKGAGFRQHYLCRPGITAYDLARTAVSAIRGDLGEIDAIVYATCIPCNGTIGEERKFRSTRDVKDLMDFPASHLQSDFELHKAFVIGLNQQACTGMLGSLRIARMLLLAEPEARRILCVTADRFPEGASYEQSYNLISDGAAACLVSSEPGGFRWIAGHAITNGSMARASDDEVVGGYFAYTHRLIQETLARAELEMADVDWIVPQNTNVKAWQILARFLKVDLERIFFPTLGEFGHVISGDNLINLKRLLEERRVRAGDRVLLVMAGYGANWQCVILERRS
jgi:3-oxoacyl-[acyl-carrier-protein] synthase III